VVLQVEDILKQYQWRILTYISLVISTRLPQQTISLRPLIDNHIYHGNELGIDLNAITFKRGLDMNDRSLRKVNIDNARYQYQGGFDISVASEVMAIFCLASSLDDLTYRLGEIQVAQNIDKNKSPIYAKDLKAQGAMAGIVKGCFYAKLGPNLRA
jgi:formate--tetrahydrofolate ligase